MKKTFVLTIGNTLEPIKKSIEDMGDTTGVDVVLVYGRPFPGQQPSPLDVANNVRKLAVSKGLAVDTKELEDPEDIDLCIETFRDVFRAHSDTDEMVVNFTAGTKVMAAAVVHAALTAPFVGNLSFDYVGGKSRDQHGRVVDEYMKTRRSERTMAREMLSQTLNLLSRGHYEEARSIANRLPNEGRARFVRQAADGLYLWDEFNYRDAVRIFRRLCEAAQIFSDDEEIGSLAKTIAQLAKSADKFEGLIDLFHQTQQSRQEPRLDGARRERYLAEVLPLLVADILENSRRRYLKGRPTESVLRSYRAIEVAIQGCLFLKYQINPWNPAWDRLDPATIEDYHKLSGHTYLPGDLALRNGLCLLRSLGLTFSEKSQKALTDVSRTRNHSYLEHGYSHVDQATSERLNQVAMGICEEILACPLDEMRTLVRHGF